MEASPWLPVHMSSVVSFIWTQMAWFLKPVPRKFVKPIKSPEDTLNLPVQDKFYLSKIDSLLYEKITNPAAGEGDPLLDSLQIYCNTLNETIQAYMKDRTGQETVDILIEQKGPICITPYVNDHLLEARYEWGVKELGEMYYMLNNIKMLWKDFRYYLTTKLGYDIDPLPLFTLHDYPTTHHL